MNLLKTYIPSSSNFLRIQSTTRILSRKVWATSKDGSIEYVSLTQNLLEPSIRTMRQSLYINEIVCVAFGVPDQPECFPEMDGLLHRIVKDGVSVVAVDKATGKIAGACFNKLTEPGESIFYQDYLKTCKYPASRGVTQWMLDIDSMFDIFDYCKVTSIMELMFVGVSSEYREFGIARKLSEVSIDVARRLKNGENVKVSAYGGDLDLGNPPQVVTGICTSLATEKIAERLGFKTATKIDFNKFNYHGKSLGIVIGNHRPYLTYVYLKL